jgi:hypothetical protein
MCEVADAVTTPEKVRAFLDQSLKDLKLQLGEEKVIFATTIGSVGQLGIVSPAIYNFLNLLQAAMDDSVMIKSRQDARSIKADQLT